MTRQLLKKSWLDTASRAGLAAPASAAVFLDLCRRYSGPGRAYHTLDHVAAMLDTIDGFTGWVSDEVAVRLAVWFHDAVYDSQCRDNEEQSAVYATTVLNGSAVSVAVERQILATKTHQCPPGDTDCQLLLDADLAILGASPEDYDRYARAIREEYAWVSDADYRAGRKRVVESFLGRDRLYQTDQAYLTGEEAARANLRREIARLTDTSNP